QELLKENKQVAQQGVQQLNQAVKAAGGRNLAEAKEAFLSAQTSFETLNQNLKALIPPTISSQQNPTTLDSLQTLTQWSTEVSQWGADLTSWAELHIQEAPSLDSLYAGDASSLLKQLDQ